MSPPRGRDGSQLSEGYRLATRFFAALMVVFGIAIVVVTIAQGGGPASTGIWIGAAFLAMGCLRLYMALRRDR